MFIDISINFNIDHLNCRMQEGNTVQKWLPLWHVANVQLVLRYDTVRSFETGFDSLWRFSRELDGSL